MLSPIPIIKLSFNAMRTNKVRTGLTVLGVVIGIASVIIVFSAGEGIRGLVLGQIQSFGTDIIETEIKVPSAKKGFQAEAQSGSAIAQGVQVTTLTIKDMDDLNRLPNVKQGYAGILSQQQVSYSSEARKAFLMGVSASFIDIDKSEIDYGRFYTEAEDKSLAEVAVLGAKMKNKLFGDSDPIGLTVKINKTKFKIIGVMKPRGAVLSTDFDDYVYLPVRTLQKKVMGIDYVFLIVNQLNDLTLADQTADDARLVLRDNHSIADPAKDDFRVITMAEAMSTLSTVTGAITLLLLAIVTISLVVGGVGIMNIMYVVITERVAEIGLRKAVGANYLDIMLQFLFESIMITMLGGIIGIVIGMALAWLIAWVAESYGLDWHFTVPAKAYITAVGFSVFFGVIFGLYPASQAAKLDPVEALRQE